MAVVGWYDLFTCPWPPGVRINDVPACRPSVDVCAEVEPRSCRLRLAQEHVIDELVALLTFRHEPDALLIHIGANIKRSASILS